MIAQVRLWGSTIGVIEKTPERAYATFQYDRDFAGSGIEVSPMRMPLRAKQYEFPRLPLGTFHGLPGMLADSLPDRFGNALINEWLSRQGRTEESFGAVERLCYTGTRGMGALEFEPVLGPKAKKATKIEVGELVKLASQILTNRESVRDVLSPAKRKKALEDILQVGTSAGGARAKAVIAWNRQTDEVRSGQVTAGEGFEYWLLKFDGVAGNKDKDGEDPAGYGTIEYAYYLMARAAGITMSECRLLEENGRRHFMTKRFDRLDSGKKLHMQSLAALNHFDYNDPLAYSYEQALQTMRLLKLSPVEFREQFRRMAFNIAARNQDDHVKNIAFLMNKEGEWRLSPAFDMTYSYRSTGGWTAKHQMSMNGKRDEFTMNDFRDCGRLALLKNGEAKAIAVEVCEVVSRWAEFAEEAKLASAVRVAIAKTHRLSFPDR
ncbi:type II toxin-antitoxin system HipA family toxin [soil metagenome]